MKDNIIEAFFSAFFNARKLTSVYTKDTPKEMMASPVDEEGWFIWKPLNGTFSAEDYRKVEEKFNVVFPQSFINFHKRYFFLDCDCRLLRLPYSNPNQPLQEITDPLEDADYLASLGLYPFAWEGNDNGHLVFDGREDKENNEFPIRLFDYSWDELDGLSAIIFSSFSKLLECLTHYMKEVKTRQDFDVVPDFLEIDPEGAGKYGREYWLGWAGMMKGNYEYFKDNPWPF
ncbi:SMI1/KNR4 family protein [Pedobacter sp. Hv1]|uniref:SMI1/KNR4 family protein n=1 Tax=Pedobacter sp. Hv1 TaxID=1740090 RepID=UPI0006D89181|nr:SMI1/KNR4 family protein [Pedobacter sp. Hv1]KQB99151.1 hypothetical protein AQF98_16340 [Pedobacter sp. Hv1]